MKKTAYCD